MLPPPLQPPSVAQAYVPALQGANMTTSDPQLFPDIGIWHPMAPTFYEDIKEYLNWCVHACVRALAWHCVICSNVDPTRGCTMCVQACVRRSVLARSPLPSTQL